jgi:hypothetical protein
LLHAPLETAKSTLDGFTFVYFDLGHPFTPPFSSQCERPKRQRRHRSLPEKQRIETEGAGSGTFSYADRCDSAELPTINNSVIHVKSFHYKQLQRRRRGQPLGIWSKASLDTSQSPVG